MVTSISVAAFSGSAGEVGSLVSSMALHCTRWRLMSLPITMSLHLGACWDKARGECKPIAAFASRTCSRERKEQARKQIYT